MNIVLKPLSAEFTEDIHNSIQGNVAEYFYDFKNITETSDWIKRAIEQHEAGTKQEFVIVDDEQFIGLISPNFISPTKVDIGMWISPNQQGKGYGKKGLALLLEKLKGEGIEEVLYVADKENNASIALAESLDFSLEKTTNSELHFSKRL